MNELKENDLSEKLKSLKLKKSKKKNKKKKKKLNVIDLFCGCGGMSKGLQDAGLNIIAGIDIWDVAINSYKQNYEHHAICEDLTKFPPNKFKKEYNIKKRNIDIIVGGPPCFVAGTKVLTNEGYKNIEDIKGNELLLTHTGKFKEILNLQRKFYKKKLYKIRAKYHPYAINCTDNHPFYVRERKRKWNNKIRKYEYHFEEPKWVESKNLTMNHFLGFPINNKEIIPSFKITKKINQFTYKNISLILNKQEQWFLLGYFVGDGWIIDRKKKNGKKRNDIFFVINDKQFNEIYPILSKVLNLTICKRQNKSKCRKVYCSNIIWFNILNKFGKYAHGKLIPEWVQNAPEYLIKEFINGYMKADGHLRKNGSCRITTVSPNLAFGVQRLFLKLGYFFSINYTKRPPTHVIEGRTVNQRNTYQIEGWFKKTKRTQKSFIDTKNNYAWFSPFKITNEPLEKEITVYNFEVDEDNSYSVENIIVHNCQGFSLAGKRDKKDPRNSLFMEFYKYITYFKPKVFLMENVIGILSMKTAKNEKVIDIIMDKLNENYNCIINKLYAYEFKVPQLRRRTIIIGIRKDLNKIPEAPIPLCDKTNWVPVKTIIEPREDVDKKNFLSERAINGIKAKKEKMKDKKYGFGAQFLNLDRPSYTIPARYWKDGYDALVKYNDNEIRRLTIKELKRIQTFPDDYVLEGNKKEKIMQIGNAVASKFAFHLGKHIINILQ